MQSVGGKPYDWPLLDSFVIQNIEKQFEENYIKNIFHVTTWNILFWVWELLLVILLFLQQK